VNLFDKSQERYNRRVLESRKVWLFYIYSSGRNLRFLKASSWICLGRFGGLQLKVFWEPQLPVFSFMPVSILI